MSRFTCTKCHQVYESDKRADGVCYDCRILVLSKPMTEDPCIEFNVDNEIFRVEPVIYGFSKPKRTDMVKSSWQAFPIFLNMNLPNLAKRLSMAFCINVSPQQVTDLVTQSIRQGIFKIVNESESRVQIFFTMSNYLQNPILEIGDSSKLVTTLISKVNSVIKHQSQKEV